MILKIFLYSTFLNFIFCQSFKNFQSSGVYFKYLGDLKVKKELFVIETNITLSKFYKVDGDIRQSLNLIKSKCPNEPSHNIEENRKLISIYLQYINEHFGQKYSNRKRRSPESARFDWEMKNNLNYVQENKKKIQELHSINNELSRKISHQEDQINSATKSIINFESFVSSIPSNINNLSCKSSMNDLRIFATEIRLLLREIKQTILDARNANLLHSIIISPDKFMNILQNQRRDEEFLTIPHLQNYYKIIKTVTTKARLIPDSKTIIISIEIPLYGRSNSLYEVINVPLLQDHKILSLRNQDKYCVVTKDKSQFHCMEEKSFDDFVLIDDFYICEDDKLVQFMPTSKQHKCVINILRGRSFKNCKFKEIGHNLEIFKQIRKNVHLFVIREETGFKYQCQNVSGNGTLSGTGLLYLNPDCKIYTANSTLVSDSEVQGYDRNDIYKFGMMSKVGKEFKNYSFNSEIKMEKTVLKLENLISQLYNGQSYDEIEDYDL